MMDWNVKWAMDSEKGQLSGEEIVSGVKVVDAINAFLRNRENRSKRIIGINAIQEKPIRKRRRIRDYESNY
jgi:hypothetical protein